MAGSRLKRGGQFCLAAVLSIACARAAAPAIGVASAVGTFTLDSTRVEGNSNLFEGSRIKTGMASSQLYLQNGAALTLGTNSSGTVYQDRIVLEQGAARFDKMERYAVEAANYRLEAAQPATQAVVRLNGNIVEAAALHGALTVFDRRGALLTRIGAGTASAFQNNPPQSPQTGANPPQSSATTGQSGATTSQTGANPPESGATAGQTGATAGQSGATAETGAGGKRKTALYVILGASLGGLGLAVDAILQPAPTSP